MVMNMHPYVIVGSFWDDVGNAVLTITGTKLTNQFIHDNHLEGVVGLAGQAVATFYGGPAAGAAAGALAPSIMSLGVEDKKKAKSAQANVQGVKAVARQAGPQMAQAVDLAHGALQHTATAYHVAQIVKDAKAGNPQAQQSIANLQAAAASGDPQSKRALDAASMLDAAQQAAGPAPGPPVGEWQQIAGMVIGCVACEAQSVRHNAVGAAIGAAIDDLRERARGYATAKPGGAAGVIQMADGRFHVRGFPNLDAAIDWLQRSTSRRGDFIYAAAYEKSRDGSAYIQDEEFGAGGSGAIPAAASGWV